MTRHLSRMMLGSAAASALTLFSASAAVADLTAEDVWQQWSSYLERAGYAITTGSADSNGGTLTITDLMLTSSVEGTDLSMTMPEIAFRENGDGTVDIAFPASFPLNMEAKDGGEDVEMTMTFSHEDLGMTASGDPENTTYDMGADLLTFSLDSVTAEGETFTDVATAALTNIAGQYALTSGELMGYLSDLTAEALTYSVDFAEDDGSIKIAGTMTDITSKTSGAMPAEGDPEDMASFLAAGFTADATMAFSGAAYALEGSGEGETFDLEGTSGSGEVDVTMSEGGFGYSGMVKDLVVAASGSGIPLPSIDVTMGEYGFKILMPVAESEEPQDFAAAFRLADVSVSDMIWGLFDPAGMLPRDPATVELDLSGKGNWQVDIFDEDAPEAMQGEFPGELHELDLNALQLKIAGADLTGTGAFTFDNSDRETYPGMPRPEGAVTLKLVGANALMETLGQMGLLPQEQLMGTRMMLGLFSRPGEGEDTLVSTIEVDENGSLFANRQQLR